MTSIIKLQTLSGAMDESPPSYLLQIDDVKILLDCGWDEKFNMEFIKEIRRQVHQIDAVLLSYPDCMHLGALPYLVGKLGLNCPIYSTIPIHKMGQMFMYDMYQAQYNMKEFGLYNLDDVDNTFDKIVQLKYNQSIPLKGKGYGLTITPLPAGHMIGGTIWKIKKAGEEDIIYANCFNHKKERHLNGCELEKLQRPSLLIIDAFNASYQQARRRARDEKLMTNILQTLRNGGNVLIAVDTAGRVLELAHMLDQLWRNRESGLLAYSLALLNHVAYNVVEFAKSQIEWMSDKLMRSFEGARNNPFQFRHLHLCHSLHELNKIKGPKVVLASSPDMESGFSRELFLQWANNDKNSIILTTRTSPGTLARDLIDNGGGRAIEITVERRVKLEGEELQEYEKRKKDVKIKIFKSESDSDSDSDIEMSVITKGKHDIVIKQEGKIGGGFFKVTKKQHPMFPFREEKVKCDDYGEIVKIDDYKMADIGPEAENEKENLDIKKEEDDDDEIEIEEIPDIPSKCIMMQRVVQVNALVQYIDFEGRSDGESLMKILSQLRPRRVIVVHGTPENTEIIKKHCEDNVHAKVFTPQKGEIVDATTETHIYQVRLTDALVSQLEFRKAKDCEVAFINAQIMFRETQADAKRLDMDDEPMEINDDETRILTLEPYTEDKPHEPVFVNEFKLSEFKTTLAKSGIPSEFVGAVLWCSNGSIAVRKVEDGQIVLEGCISEDYYRVKDLLYDQFAIL